jgi:fructose-1,6-bisphosphatase/inositol monophosphatase family enzyme
MKNGEFSVMIAFLKKGRIEVGVVLEPAKERLTWAVRGEGYWRQDSTSPTPTRCRVTAVKSLSHRRWSKAGGMVPRFPPAKAPSSGRPAW